MRARELEVGLDSHLGSLQADASQTKLLAHSWGFVLSGSAESSVHDGADSGGIIAPLIKCYLLIHSVFFATSVKED